MCTFNRISLTLKSAFDALKSIQLDANALVNVRLGLCKACIDRCLHLHVKVIHACIFQAISKLVFRCGKRIDLRA